MDAGAEVVVLEAGNADTNPAIHDPARQGELWHGPEDWDYYTTPQPGAAGRRLHLPRGKVLGGSHALNAMIYVRGAAEDFDAWAQAGSSGWSWDDVLPIYQHIENGDSNPSLVLGRGGLLDIQSKYPLNPIQQAIVDAAVQSGVPENPNYNSGVLDGVSCQQVTMRDQRRWSTYLAYLKPFAADSRCRIVTGARVHRVTIRSGRVAGAVYDVAGQQHAVDADGVVLCAGTIDTPRILQRSGIGPAAQLRAAGVEPVIDLPGVGQNLHDHLLSPVIFAADKTIPKPRSGESVTQTHLFQRSRPDLSVPDTQPIHFSVGMYEPWMSGPDNAFTLMAGMIRPASRGSLMIAGPEADDEVSIDLAALHEDVDREALAYSVRQCREIGRQSALADEWGAREIYPDPNIGDAAELDDYVCRTAITYHHQVGTCAMGTDGQSVVDPGLAVHGVSGLSVADASVMPRITSGNTNGPTIMIAERAAEFLDG
jgi:choline dehydrogenase